MSDEPATALRGRHRLGRMMLPVAAALTLCAALSVKWLLPIAAQLRSAGKYVYVPIRFGHGQYGDDYFYYTFVRKVLDGCLPGVDPHLAEGAHALGMYTSQALSFVMCALGGLATNQTEHAYFFNETLYPALAFVLSYMLIHEITGDRHLGLFGALASFMAAYLTGNLTRMPSVQFTSVPLLAFGLLLLRHVNRSPGVRSHPICLTILLGSSSLTSPANFLASYACFGLAMLFHLDRNRLRADITILTCSAVLSLPGVWLSIAGLKPYSEIFGALVYSYAPLGPEGVQLPLAAFLLPLAALSFAKAPNRRFLAAVLAACLGVYLAFCAKGNMSFASRTLFRGTQMLVWPVTVSAFSPLFCALSARIGRLLPARLDRRMLLTLLFAPLLTICAWYIASTSNPRLRIDEFNGPRFHDLASWARTACTNQEAFLSLDVDLVVNLPVYAPLRVYIPQALLSPCPTPERLLRFFEAARFHGWTPEDMDAFLSGLPFGHVARTGRTWAERESGLWQQVLFYGLHDESKMDTPMPTKERYELTERYREMLASSSGLSFRADYLILAQESSLGARPGSEAERISRTCAPIFASEAYSVYRISGNLAEHKDIMP